MRSLIVRHRHGLGEALRHLAGGLLLAGSFLALCWLADLAAFR